MVQSSSCFFCLDVSHRCGPSILHDDRGWGWIEERGRGSRLFCIAQSEGSVFEDFDFFIFGDGENVLHGMCSGKLPTAFAAKTSTA